MVGSAGQRVRLDDVSDRRSVIFPLYEIPAAVGSKGDQDRVQKDLVQQNHVELDQGESRC